ncbi:hypothetical protein GJ496_008881 [Pomphorhynchus laevis]|nr:hypothetical protein GJ496_008881 [Pomphorhynchus laevis]
MSQRSLALHIDRPSKLLEEKSDEHFYAHGTENDELPIGACRSQFSKIISENQVLLVIGETGSGKSTLLPQFMLNDPVWVGVCVSEPRRLAAVNLASYISSQKDCKLGGPEVGYVIRYEECISEETRLIFTTVGLLLRTFLFDPLLERYQVVMLDEIHERSVDMDVALALLKKVVLQRSDFRILLASATPDVDHIKNFFGSNLAVLTVPGRQYPVSIFHIKNPVPDYIKACYQTIVHIHESKKFDTGAVLCFLPGKAEISQVESLLLDYVPLNKGKKLTIIPLYAALPHSRKIQAFRRSAQYTRKIILATSIAETSLTIPDVVFVVDAGFTRIKCKNYRNANSESLITVPITWQEADQRTGRAGRLKSGECFRIYPKDADLKQYPEPEIRRVDLTGYLMRLLAIGIDNLVRFDLPSQPSVQSILSALDTLLAMNFIDSETGKLTELYGYRAVELPLDCKYSSMLFKAEEMGCLDEMLDIVSAFQVRDVFTSRMKKLRLFGAKEGDIISLLNAVRSFRNCAGNELANFCSKHGLNFDALRRAQRIRKQIEKYFNFTKSNLSEVFSSTDIILRCLISGLFQNAVMLSHKQSEPNPGGEYESLIDRTNQNRYHIHRHSVFYGMEPLPQYLVYHTLSEDNIMFEVSLVRDVKWFNEIVPNYFSYGTERELNEN